MTTRERVHEIVREETGYRGDITDETTWDNLGADSLDTVELIMQLEDNFAIDIPDELAESWENVGQAIAYLEGLEEVA